MTRQWIFVFKQMPIAGNVSIVEHVPIATAKLIAHIVMPNYSDLKDTVTGRAPEHCPWTPDPPMALLLGDTKIYVNWQNKKETREIQFLSNISSYAQAQVAPILDGRTSRSSTDSASSGSLPTGANINSASSIRLGGCEVCRRCGKPVYMAERLLGAGAVSYNYSPCQLSLSLYVTVCDILMICSYDTKTLL